MNSQGGLAMQGPLYMYSLETDWLKQPILLFRMLTTCILVLKSTNNLTFSLNCHSLTFAFIVTFLPVIVTSQPEFS